MNKLSSISHWRSSFAELLGMTGLGIMVHAGVLFFVYPGFYDPFWPHHSDFYIGPALANSSISYLQYLTMPRSVGALFMKITGHLGIRGAIVANLFLVIINCAITAMILRRVAALRLNWTFWAGCSIYLFLVFSHPAQYIWSAYDVFSQLSYFLLACAVMLDLRGAGIFALFFLYLCAFLAKETFGLSAIFLCVIYGVMGHRNNRPRSIRTGVAIVLALGIALILNRVNQSIFIGGADHASSPYQVNVSLNSLVSEWMRYAVEGLSLGTGVFMAIVAVGSYLFRHTSSRILRVMSVALPVAGALAWLPNSVFPNHHYSGYSWDSSYLLFAPALFLGALWTADRWARGFVFAVGIFALSTPIFATGRYISNEWILEQQHRQHRLLNDLEWMIQHLSADTRSILVTGMDFPFSPFDHGLSLHSLGDIGATQFSVVSYSKRDDTYHAFSTLRAHPTPVRFISPEEAKRGNFDEIWMFRSDGSLIRSMHLGQNTMPEKRFGFMPIEMMIFPKVAEALGVVSDAGGNPAQLVDGYRLLNCGTALISYQQPALAMRCLEASIQKIPENPYPYFYQGIALEQNNRIEEAKHFFEKAIARDDPGRPNSAFKDGLQRAELHGNTNIDSLPGKR